MRVTVKDEADRSERVHEGVARVSFAPLDYADDGDGYQDLVGGGAVLVFEDGRRLYLGERDAFEVEP